GAKGWSFQEFLVRPGERQAQRGGQQPARHRPCPGRLARLPDDRHGQPGPEERGSDPRVPGPVRCRRRADVPADPRAAGDAAADRRPPQRQEEGRAGRGGLEEVLRGREGVSGGRMSRLERASEVADLAATLGLGGAGDPVGAILRHCRSRIDGWVAEAGGIKDIRQLEALVTRKLQMVFEEVRADEDFDRIKEQYARAKKDFVFAAMRVKFDDADNPTYGALVRR